jgi:hypothetical protein
MSKQVGPDGEQSRQVARDRAFRRYPNIKKILSICLDDRVPTSHRKGESQAEMTWPRASGVTMCEARTWASSGSTTRIS